LPSKEGQDKDGGIPRAKKQRVITNNSKCLI
jgi:hypothetical protein